MPHFIQISLLYIFLVFLKAMMAGSCDHHEKKTLMFSFEGIFTKIAENTSETSCSTCSSSIDVGVSHEEDVGDNVDNESASKINVV